VTPISLAPHVKKDYPIKGVNAEDGEHRDIALAAEVKVKSSRISSSSAEKVDRSSNAGWPGGISCRIVILPVHK
jgi:hypothetical protein